MIHTYDKSHTLAWNRQMMQMKQTARELNNDIIFLIRDVVLIKSDMCKGEFDWIDGRIEQATDGYKDLCRRRNEIMQGLDRIGMGYDIIDSVLSNLKTLSKYFEEE